MTKGALYYHFDSKEALASAIIDEGSAIVLNRFRNICTASAPAFENLIHGSFVVSTIYRDVRTAYMGAVLSRALSGTLDAPSRGYFGFLEVLTEQAERAAAEGDLGPDVAPAAVGELILFAMLGAEVVSSSTGDHSGATARLTRMWETVLPGLVAPDALPYLREFLARESRLPR